MWQNAKEMPNDLDELQPSDIWDNGDPGGADFINSPIVSQTPFENYFQAQYSSQIDAKGIPIVVPIKSELVARTADSGHCSMVTPASTLESPYGAQNIPIKRQNQGIYQGPNSFGQSSGNGVTSPTSSLKRSSVDSYQNDENKRWKTTSSEGEPKVIMAKNIQQTSASNFPTADIMPIYGARIVRLESSMPKQIQNGRGGSGLTPANGGAQNRLARSQPIGQQIGTNHANGQFFSQNVEVNEVCPRSNFQPMDANKYFNDQHNLSTSVETLDMRGKCSPHTSNALQGVIKRHTDNQVNQGGLKSSPPINIIGSAGSEVSSQASNEEEKRRRQQEKNRQYAKDSRERKNERLKNLEQKTKEQEAEMEILKKVIAHYYVKQHKSEPQWTETVREWFSNQGGNSQTRIEVTCYLPNDEEMLRELGNSPYGSVISPVKSRQPDVKSESVDVIDITDDSMNLLPSASASFSSGEFSASGVKGNSPKGQSAQPARKSLFKSRSHDTDRREHKPEMNLRSETENGVDIVQDSKLLEEHRQEESYSVGIFSGSRTEVKQQKTIDESPWDVTFADHATGVAEEVVIGTTGEEAECVTMSVDQFPECLINSFISLGSMDFFVDGGSNFVESDQPEIETI